MPNRPPSFSQLSKRVAVVLCPVLASPTQAEVLQLERVIPAPAHAESMGARIAGQGTQILAPIVFEDDNSNQRRTPLLIDGKTGETIQVLQDNPDPIRLLHATALDFDGTRALVCGSAMVAGEDTPQSRLFDTVTGTIIARFRHSDLNAGQRDLFGASCQLSDDTVLITAPRLEDKSNSAVGAVYLYDAAIGELQQSILPHAPLEKSTFGTDAVLHGGLLAISSTGMDFKRGYFGYVDLYDRSSGTHLHRFTRPDNGISYNSGRFGASLAMDRTRLVIGSNYDTLKSKRETGSVWVYDLSDFSLLHRLTPPKGISKNSHFGKPLAMWKDLLLVGAPDISVRKDADGRRQSDAGMAFLFDLVSGTLLQEIPNPSPSPSEQFGAAVILGPDGAVISASHARTESEGLGGLYVYQIADRP